MRKVFYYHYYCEIKGHQVDGVVETEFTLTSKEYARLKQDILIYAGVDAEIKDVAIKSLSLLGRPK